MAKKMKKKGNRRRSFKVHSDFNGGLYVRFGGKYLSHELGLACGDRLELTRDKDMIMLRKCSAQEVAEYEKARQAKEALAVLKKLFPDKQHKAAAMMVAEDRSNTYTVDEELYKHPERYL